jgi:hypothetical protein
MTFLARFSASVLTTHRRHAERRWTFRLDIALLPAALIPLESAKRRMGVFQRYDITAGRGSALFFDCSVTTGRRSYSLRREAQARTSARDMFSADV